MEENTFCRCAESGCGHIYWDSQAKMQKHGMECPYCFGNKSRFPGRLSLFERFYLLRMFFWETIQINQIGYAPDSDPKWYWKPMNVLKVAWIGLHPVLDFSKKEKTVGA